MKNGTAYGKKLKKAIPRFRGSAPKSELECADAIEQLIVAVLSQETSIQRAHKATQQLLEDMIDFNELRVSTPAEISTSIQKHVPHSVQRGKVLVRVLNAIYKNEYAVSLDRLKGKGVREIKSYLDSLDAITPYVSASLLLWSLNGHAIPVNDPTLEMLRSEDLVDAGADTAEVQAFLERHISAADAKSFACDIEAYAAKGRFTAKSDGAKTSAGRKKATARKPRSTTNRKTSKKKKTSTKSKTTGSKRPSKGKTTRKRAAAKK